MSRYNMKKGIFLAMLASFVVLTTFPAFTQETTIKPKGENVWELCGEAGVPFATVKKRQTGGLSFYDASGKYIGVIQHSGTWVPWNARKRVTTIKSEEAELFLEVLKVANRSR